VRWLVLLGYALGVLFVGTLPQNGGLPSINDKLLHFTVFGGLGALSLFAFVPFQSSGWHTELNRAAWRALLIAAGVGALLEVLQAYTPGRSADVADWIADCLGIVPAILLGRLALGWGSPKPAIRTTGTPQP
jgi:VanZ family protein